VRVNTDNYRRLWNESLTQPEVAGPCGDYWYGRVPGRSPAPASSRRSAGPLPGRFRDHPFWRPFFEKQTRAAHELIERYGEAPVISALLTKKGKSKRIKTLGSRKLKELVREEARKLYQDAKTTVPTRRRPNRLLPP
jgi:hypothetical protein